MAYGLPGDTVRIRVVRQAKNVLWARVEEVLDPSPDRLDAPCLYFGTCGCCSWLNFAYPAQAEWKRRNTAAKRNRQARSIRGLRSSEDACILFEISMLESIWTDLEDAYGEVELGFDNDEIDPSFQPGPTIVAKF